MLVVVVRPGLCDPAVADMEHQDSWAANTAPVSFGVRAVQPDGMLVIGHHIMEGSPEGPTRTLGECAEKAEHLVEAFIVARDRAAARLMEDRRVGKHLSEGRHIGVVERVVASTDELLVWGVPWPLPPVIGVATLFLVPGGGPVTTSPGYGSLQRPGWARHRRPESVGGRGSRPGAGRRPRAGTAAQAA